MTSVLLGAAWLVVALYCLLLVGGGKHDETP